MTALDSTQAAPGSQERGGTVSVEELRHPMSHVHGVRGAALLIGGRASEAIPELEQAVQLFPIPGNFSNLGYAYLMNGKTERGEELVQRAAALPNSPLQTHYLMGLLQLDGVAQSARPCTDLERAQNLMPRAHFALAVCYTQEGKKGAADGQIRKVLGPQNDSSFDFWKKWVNRVAAQPAPASAFGLRLKPDAGTKF